MPQWFDYLEGLDPQVASVLARVGRGSAPAQPTIAPEEQQAVLANALSGIMSGVEWVGETLDKSFGGRTVRAMLDDGIDASDFAHLIPFSDTLGLTDRGLLGENLLADKTQVADPSEFRERLGWTTDKWWLDVPIDIGIGVATDPGILLTGPGKALTKLGIEATQQGARVAKGLSFTDEIAQAGKSAVLGTSPAAMANEIRAGQRGLIGIKIPFTEEPLAVFGAGSNRAAGLVEALAYNPVSAGVRQLFDTRVRGIYDPVAQKAADLLHSKTIDTSGQIIDTTLAIKRRVGELDEEFTHTLKTHMQADPEFAKQLTGGVSLDDMEADDFVRAIAELEQVNPTLGRMRQTAEGIHQAAGTQAPANVMAAFDKFDEVAEAAVGLKDRAFKVYRAMGGDVKALDDEFTKHFPRRLSDLMRQTMKSSKAAEAAANGVWGAVQRAIRDIDGGTFKVNAISKDANITALAHTPAFQNATPQVQQALIQGASLRLQNTYGIAPIPQINPATGVQAVNAKGQPIWKLHPDELAGYFARLPAEVLGEGLFSRSTTTDMMDYTLNMMRRANGLGATHQLMAQVATADPTLGPSVAEIFGKTGNVQRYKNASGQWRSRPVDAPVPVTDRGVRHFVRQYAKANKIPTAQVDINNLFVPQTLADSAERFMHYNTKPKELHGLLGAYDRALGLVKGSLYTPWPASHVRNGISGLWQNAVTAFKNPAHGARALREAAAAMDGKGNKEWLDAYKAYGLLDGGILDDIRTVERGLNAEVPFSNSTVVSELLGGVKDIASNIRHPIQTAKNLATEGGSEFAPFKAGRKIGEAIEFINRYSHFAALKERGWSNAAAARSVKLAHFDYNDLTSAERTVFKRLFTFYTFMRKNLPAQLRNLIDEPGGRTAQTIRGINIARETAQDKNEGSYIPSYLSEGLAIPLGPQVGNDRNFLVSRGLLPVEEAFNRFPFFDGLPDWLHTAENIGAATTPAFSAPMQAMSGRQWWSHRDLDDLYQTPTDNELLNHWLYSSPVSRVLTTERTWSDPRKTNLQALINSVLGGTRITTVDVPKWMQIEAREVLERELKPLGGIREYEKLYAPDLAKLDPETVAQLSVLNEVQKELSKLNKARKEAEARK